jgi:hypothetical protein
VKDLGNNLSTVLIVAIVAVAWVINRWRTK